MLYVELCLAHPKPRVLSQEVTKGEGSRSDIAKKSGFTWLQLTVYCKIPFSVMDEHHNGNEYEEVEFWNNKSKGSGSSEYT